MNDEITQKRKLVESLYLRTVEGKIEWHYDPVNGSSEATVGNGHVEMDSESDEDGNYYPVVKVLNQNKEVIDRVYGGSLWRSKPSSTGHATYADLISDLLVKAERKAKGADVVLNSILNELGADQVFLNDAELDESSF
jgi:hypothetical protein